MKRGTARSGGRGIVGLVLAGGLSRRMAGPDKALALWQGRALLEHTLQRLAPQVDRLLVSHNRRDAEVLRIAAAHHAPCMPDTLPGQLGPLAGLLAALEHLAEHAEPGAWLACVPCDAPRLPLDLVTQLAAAVAPQGVAIAGARQPDGSMRPQPAFMLLHRRHRAALAEALAAGERRLLGWASALGAVAAPFDDAAAFANVNTPADLAALDDGPAGASLSSLR